MSGPINLPLDEVRDSGEPRRSNAMSREEVRQKAAAKPTSTDRAKMIEDTFRQEREAPAPEPAEEPSEAAVESAPPDVEGDTEPEQDSDVETWEDFLERLDLSEDDLADLTRTIKVNGEEKRVTLKEAFANTQFAQANHEKAQKLAAEQRRFEAERAQRLQQYTQYVEQAKQTHMAAARVLQEELMSPQVQMLKEHDPAQYVRWQDITQQRLQALQSSYQQIVAEERKTLKTHFEQARDAGISRLRNQIEDFDTPERRQKMLNAFTEFGGTEAEFDSVVDDRILLLVSKYADMAERLRRYEQSEQQTRKKAKQLVEDSKSARAKAPRKRSAGSKQRVDAAIKNIQGKKGHRARQATQQAILTAMRENRRR